MEHLAAVYERAKQVRLVIFDVDGVLTDGSLYIGATGEEYKAFHSRDGLGMKLLQAAGIEIGIITGRSAAVVEHRMASLGIQHVYQGQNQKLPALRDLCQQLQLEFTQVAYMGDDVNDIPVLRQVGLAVTVADAHPLLDRHVHWQTRAAGGRGAARELCELIMDAQGSLFEQLARYEV